MNNQTIKKDNPLESIAEHWVALVLAQIEAKKFKTVSPRTKKEKPYEK